jgi:tetratricopeptide (TPR) repeat protein
VKRRNLHRWAAAVAALALQLSTIPTATASVPPAPGSEAAAEVEELNAAAVEAFKNKEYDEAARLFEAAYDKNPEPNYLFNIGRVYEEKGDFESAIEWYDKFIHLPEVELQAREIALERLRVLRAIVAESKAEQEEAQPKDEPEPQPDDEGKRKPTPPLRIAGYVLLGVGGAALIAGAAFGGAALQRNNDLDSLNTLEQRNDAIDKGKRNALVADSLFIAGGVIALTGLVLTLASLKKGKGKSQRASVTPSIARGHAGVAARVRF